MMDHMRTTSLVDAYPWYAGAATSYRGPKSTGQAVAICPSVCAMETHQEAEHNWQLAVPGRPMFQYESEKKALNTPS